MAGDSRLLGEGDGDPVRLVNPKGRSDVVLVCEHASNRFPAALRRLGLSDEAVESHVAWDPGALAVSQLMAEALDAALIAQNFSRLVYDCNRPPEAADAMPKRSEVYEIPGNSGLSEAEKAVRTAELYVPFHAAVEGHLKGRIEAGDDPVLVTVHSFTPVYFGKPRAVELGILHDSDTRLADAMLAQAKDFTGLTTRRNEPYGPGQGVMHTLRKHSSRFGLLNVMLEIRNDLVRTQAGQQSVASELVALLRKALSDLREAGVTRYR